jgi:DMSO/TMAO reductase YedYZ molybdopterin-dependent catalytic subunit
MLAYLWDGKPLELKHGYPLRIYIPDRYGMKQPKWIVGIDVIADWEPGYWVKRGWDREAIVRSTSVIDTVAVDDVFEENGQQLIPIGGIAYAGARGISKVEVRIDGGDWQEADLRSPLSDLTWVIWRYDWPFAEGAHLFEVRCTDGDGVPQIVEVDDSHPSGATGIHSFRERV